MRTGNLRWSWIILGAALMLALGPTEAFANPEEEGGHGGGLGTVFWRGLNETPIGWTIVLCSIISFALIVEHFLTIRRPVLIPPELPPLFEQWIKERQYTEMMQYLETDKSMLGMTIAAALARSRAGFEAMRDAAETMAGEQSAGMFRKIEWLNVIGGLGPLLGLMGTVLGMVLSFSEMTKKGATAKPEELAAGISVALINTFLGLFVAAPSLVAYGFFRGRVDTIGAEASMMAMEILENFRPGSKGGGSSSAPSGSSGRPAEASRSMQPRPAVAK